MVLSLLHVRLCRQFCCVFATAFVVLFWCAAHPNVKTYSYSIRSTKTTKNRLVYLFVKFWDCLKDTSQTTKFCEKFSDFAVDELASLLTMGLLWLHISRRLFESLFVSVYSNSKMNIFHYGTGFAHYFLASASILAEAPGFVQSGSEIFLTNFEYFCINLVIFENLLSISMQWRMCNLWESRCFFGQAGASIGVFKFWAAWERIIWVCFKLLRAKRWLKYYY